MGKCNFRVSVNLIVKDGNKICLMRRYNTGWNDGNYALMGGHVEDGENPIDAVVREAKEELGIIVDKNNVKYLLTMSVYPDHIYLYFNCDKYSGTISNNEPTQCDDIRFFDINNLPENLIEADKKALQSIFASTGSNYTDLGYTM